MAEPGGRRHIAAALRAHGAPLRDELAAHDLTGDVLAALARPEAPPAPAPRRRRRTAAVAMGAAAIGFASAAWALDTLVLDAGPVTVHRGEAPDLPLGGDLHLGAPIPLAHAQGLDLYLAPGVAWLAGGPQAWLDTEVTDQLSLTYAATPELPGISGTEVGILIQTFAGDGSEAIRKYLTTSTRATRLEVEGAPAVFLGGGDHVLFYLRSDGTYATAPGRSVGNALILQRDGLTVRIEADLPLDRLLELAVSLAPVA